MVASGLHRLLGCIVGAFPLARERRAPKGIALRFRELETPYEEDTSTRIAKYHPALMHLLILIPLRTTHLEGIALRAPLLPALHLMSEFFDKKLKELQQSLEGRIVSH